MVSLTYQRKGQTTVKRIKNKQQLMIIVILGFISALFFGGNTAEYYMVDQLDKGIKKCIEDKDTKKKIQFILKSNKKEGKKFLKRKDKKIKELNSLIASTTSSTADFDNFWTDQSAALKTYEHLIFTTRISCLKLMTEEEWKCILTLSEKKATKKVTKSQKSKDVLFFEKTQKAIEKQLLNTAEKDKAFAYLKDFDAKYHKLIGELIKQNEIDSKTIQNYHSSIQDFETIASGIHVHRKNAFDQLSKFHNAMLSICNEKQWKSISKAFIKEFNSINY